jgi:AcrR family transcriptional regulator
MPMQKFASGRVREFKQLRAAQTYERLLDAAQVVFAERGFDGAQTPDIAKEAGVSTGALYRYFDDKRQLFVEMVARNLQRAYDDVTAKLQPALFMVEDRHQAIEVALDVVFAHVQKDAELERVYLAMSLNDPEVEKLRIEWERSGLEALTTLIEALVPRSRVPNPRAAAVVVQVAVLEVAAERAGLRPTLDDKIPNEDVKAALREMLHRYLFADDEVSSPLRPARSARARRRGAADRG